MFTYDEWGKMVFHIHTGVRGMKIFEELGFKSMPREEYDKHMASYRKLKEKEEERLQRMLDIMLKWCKT